MARKKDYRSCDALPALEKLAEKLGYEIVDSITIMLKDGEVLTPQEVHYAISVSNAEEVDLIFWLRDGISDRYQGSASYRQWEVHSLPERLDLSEAPPSKLWWDWKERICFDKIYTAKDIDHVSGYPIMFWST